MQNYSIGWCPRASSVREATPARTASRCETSRSLEVVTRGRIRFIVEDGGGSAHVGPAQFSRSVWVCFYVTNPSGLVPEKQHRGPRFWTNYMLRLLCLITGIIPFPLWKFMQLIVVFFLNKSDGFEQSWSSHGSKNDSTFLIVHASSFFPFCMGQTFKDYKLSRRFSSQGP